MPPAARESGPMARLRSEASGLVGALADRATSAAREKVQGAIGRLTDYAEGNGPGLMAAVTGARSLAEGKGPIRSLFGAGVAGAREKVSGVFGGGKGKSQGRQKLKLTNIVESIDIGAPIRVVYDQWTQFGDFPTFMKKVESVQQEEDQKLNWKAQVLWSHRTWESTILDQHPEDKIIWRSKGPKGHVDGAVTFHELAPSLTRVLVVLEYHPQGLFERTGNLWRAQGRRVRLELKHFRRHVMGHVLLNPSEVEGWRGVIEDGEVVKDQETALREEQELREERETRERDGERGQEARGRGAAEGGAAAPEQAEDAEEAAGDEPAEPEEAEPEEEEEEPAGARASGDGRAAGDGAGGGRPAGRSRVTAAAPGRRPAAAPANHGEDQPRRGARQGAARGRAR
jgi:uncharacterized membrane protein